MNSVRTVVFDLDGTLVDTAPDLISALNFVLDREGLPDLVLTGSNLGGDLDDRFARAILLLF